MVRKDLDIVRLIRGQRKLNILVESTTKPDTKFSLNNTKKAVINIDDDNSDESILNQDKDKEEIHNISLFSS